VTNPLVRELGAQVRGKTVDHPAPPPCLMRPPSLHYACSMLHPMDTGTAALAATIGGRVRQERQSRRWTLDQLAEAAGVSRRMVINVEQGAANPSVGTLLRISDALGVGLPALVEPPVRKPVKVTRSGEGAALWNGESGGRGVLVAGTEPPDVVELWDWTLEPGDRYVSHAHAPGTKELLQVQQGSVTMEVADEPITLEVGDSLAFPGDVAHSYANPTTEPARFSLAVFEPGVGSGPRPEATDA
jgi:transcriptional regulator with XRE-family HTH domain